MKDQLENIEHPPAQSSAPTAVSESGESAPQPEIHEADGTTRRPVKQRKAIPKRRVTRSAGSARPALPPRPIHHYEKLTDEDENDGFFAHHRTKIIIAAVVLLCGGAAYFLSGVKSTTAPKAPERMVSIQPLPPLPPPPPPPPPKVQPPPPKEEKMVQETAAEEKKVEAPKAPEPPKEALGTNLKGAGPGMAGLGGSGNGGGTFGGQPGGGGSKWGAFAGQVQSKVASALRSNSKTKKANLKIQVRVWSDTTGRITRAMLDTKTGDSTLDQVIQNEILTNLQLDQPPPAGMPMPIVMRLTARRP
ncbi:MAG: TonB C-terminal domain-containing protein [Chthoniobacter sp.]|uniref:TonB C-terminal domain-containing protein n=1 Tax=Chthoniobacter sp. TaxID=2510640 RepID=UPI0032AC8180